MTFLDDGSVIFGCPWDLTEDEYDAIADVLSQYDHDRGSVLVLPFPVDVVDLRKQLP
jgi:hypothetical protein